ncbi:hypothetical protein [Chryseobacterium sp. SL1]|uniref:hypothetical protein n=1 Tax=Chryseobacterium sp. SL1 TaxID=2995159 RepID=UPI0022742A6E|nr:hypothetical protein [Chryseobacterium sp. SL1]MCY1660124.1 hypothetical protein [Chryseobacterium sp. SL1]
MKTPVFFKLMILGTLMIACRETESEIPQLVTPSADAPSNRQKVEAARNDRPLSIELTANRKDSLKAKEILFRASDSLGQRTEVVSECCGDHGQIPVKN